MGDGSLTSANSYAVPSSKRSLMRAKAVSTVSPGSTRTFTVAFACFGMTLCAGLPSSCVSA